MYELKFRLNLSHEGNTFQDHNEVEKVAGTKSTYMPIGVVGTPSLVGKHGDIFTLYGSQARQLKKLIDQGMAPHCEIYVMPNVNDLVLEANEDQTGVNVTWNSHASYFTQVQYRINSGDWVTLPLVDKGVGEI